MHLDGLVHAPSCLVPGAPRRHTAGEIRRVGRVVAARPLDDNQETVHRTLPSLRPSQAGLLQDTAQRAGCQIVTWVSGNCNAPQLGRMLVLAMAPLRHKKEPAIVLYQPNDISDLHPPGPLPSTWILAWCGKVFHGGLDT